MGAVKVMLSKKSLKDREKHNSRLFVDLCENIHIHYREYRLLFSLPEYFEFVDIVNRSTADVRSYLVQNPDYEEGRYKTTLMVAGGPQRQMKFLENSPEPHRSVYFNNDLTIELQEEYITDEVHVHYRDLRLAMNRENFKDLADGFVEARETLKKFEESNTYDRRYHPDREIKSWDQSDAIRTSNTPLMGRKMVDLSVIRSHWHQDLINDWKPNVSAIQVLKDQISSGAALTPIVLTRADAGGHHLIVDGHHRVRAYLELGRTHIPAIVSDMSWDESEPIRRAESSLKEFDRATDHRYNASAFFKDFLAHSTNKYYRDHFYRLVATPSVTFRALRSVKRALLKIPMPNALRAQFERLSLWLARQV